MKAAEMKLEKLDNRDVIVTSGPVSDSLFRFRGYDDSDKGNAKVEYGYDGNTIWKIGDGPDNLVAALNSVLEGSPVESSTQILFNGYSGFPVLAVEKIGANEGRVLGIPGKVDGIYSFESNKFKWIQELTQ